MKLSPVLFLLLMSLACRIPARAQDSLSVTAESSRTDSIIIRPGFQPDAKKAGLYSALIPGLGQLYNRQYWKVPVIYAGLGAAAFFLYP